MSLVYHGSDTVIKRPQVLRAGYGNGFYVTRIKSQAQKWAHKGFNNCEDVDWVDFIAGCRNGIPHNYDTVEGPMADDYIAHRIPREVFKV